MHFDPFSSHNLIQKDRGKLSKPRYAQEAPSIQWCSSYLRFPSISRDCPKWWWVSLSKSFLSFIKSRIIWSNAPALLYMLMTRSGSPQPGTCMLAVSLEWTTATNGSFAFWRERVLSQTDECISGARTTYGTTRWRSTSATSTARTWC